MDVQHAHRPCPRHLPRRPRAGQRDLRRRGTRPSGGAAFLQREPDPAGGLQPGRGAVLHQRVGRLRQGAQAVRPAAGRQPGHPVPARRAGDPVRDAARADPQDGLADGYPGPVLRLRQGVDVQLLGQPAVLRGRRPGHAGARRARLLAAQAVRAHLPPSPPVPHHRGRRRRSRCAASPGTCSASCASARPRASARADGRRRAGRGAARHSRPGDRRGRDPDDGRRVPRDLGLRRRRRRTARAPSWCCAATRPAGPASPAR